MKKTFILLVAGATMLSAGGDISPVENTSTCGLYTYSYMPQSGVEHPCIDTGIANAVSGKMLLNKKIRFHTSLYTDGHTLTEASQQALQQMKEALKAHPNAYVALIGHTSGYADAGHYVPLDGWSSFWQSLGGERTLTQEEAANEVNGRIKDIYDVLTGNEGINPSKIYTENRLARDPVSTEATGAGRALNERVDILLLD